MPNSNPSVGWRLISYLNSKLLLFGFKITVCSDPKLDMISVMNDGVSYAVGSVTIFETLPVLDSQTWYRAYDGVKADSAKFWEFGNSTKNASNQITDEDAFLGLEINVDRELYSFGDTASITGKVSKIVTDPTAYDTPSFITLIISSLGSEQTVILNPNNNNLEFKYDISLQPTLGFEFGMYTINASYGQWTAGASFMVVEEQMQAIEDTTKFLQVSADSSIYNPGQTVMMSGSTNAYAQYEAVSYSVTDPNGGLYRSGTLFPNEDGTFAADFQIIQSDSMIGAYHVNFEYANYMADLTFDVKDVDVSDNPIDIVFDKDVYGLDDMVKITGTINDVAIVSVDIIVQQVTHEPESITKYHDKKTDSVRTLNSKDFSYEYTIHDNPDRLGKYKITFTSSDHHEERIFIVVADPENYVPDTLPFTIMSNKPTYNVGDFITFSGVVNEAKGDITQGQVVITMTDPGGNKLTTASAKSGN